MHRICAHKELGLTEIEVTVRDIPDEEVFIESIKSNKRQGKQLTMQDRQQDSILLYEEIRDLHKIAEILDVKYDCIVRWTRDIRQNEKEIRNEKIEQLNAEGKTQEEIADDIGLSQSRVSGIIGDNDVINSNNEIEIEKPVEEWSEYDIDNQIPEDLKPEPVETIVNAKLEKGCIICSTCGRKIKLVEITKNGSVIGHKIY